MHVADGAAYNTSITLTDVTPLPQIQFPAMMLEAGSELELNASGSFSNTGTPTLLLGFYFGGVAGVALAASAAVTTTTAAASWPWQLHYRGVVRSIGTAGSIQGQGRLYLPTAINVFQVRAIPETLAARTVTINTTIVQNITVGAQWGTSSASNTLTVNDISVKLVT